MRTVCVCRDVVSGGRAELMVSWTHSGMTAKSMQVHVVCRSYALGDLIRDVMETRSDVVEFATVVGIQRGLPNGGVVVTHSSGAAVRSNADVVAAMPRLGCGVLKLVAESQGWRADVCRGRRNATTRLVGITGRWHTTAGASHAGEHHPCWFVVQEKKRSDQRHPRRTHHQHVRPGWGRGL